MSIKISFKHYMKWTRVSRDVFKEFELVCVLFLFFSFHSHCQLVKDQLQQKSGGGGDAAPPSFYGPAYCYENLFNSWLKLQTAELQDIVDLKNIMYNRKTFKGVSLRDIFYCTYRLTDVEILEKYLSILCRYSSRNFSIDFGRAIFENTSQLQHSKINLSLQHLSIIIIPYLTKPVDYGIYNS